MSEYRNRTILAILNLYVIPMPLIKVWLGRCCLKNFKMAAMVAILDIKTDVFSHSEFLCCSNASHQVSAQSEL